MEMPEYHKIESVWERVKRDNQKGRVCPFIEGAWRGEVFSALRHLPWEWTEKIDGTNIRVGYDFNAVKLGGRTDNAQMPTRLMHVLNVLFTPATLAAAFPVEEGKTAEGGFVLVGEGYGQGIQAVGKNYIADNVSFVLFDVQRISGDGRTMWLDRAAVSDIGAKLGVRVAPTIGVGTLDEAIEHTRAGFLSSWGPFVAEGMICRPPVELLTARGNRVITKIKCSDFEKASV